MPAIFCKFKVESGMQFVFAAVSGCLGGIGKESLADHVTAAVVIENGPDFTE